MYQRNVWWVDPYTNEPLVEENGFLISATGKYPLYDGIPNFVRKLDNPLQEQVQQSFGNKWTKSDFGQDDHDFEKIKNPMLQMMGLNESDLSIFQNKIVLDTGIGSGSSARLWAQKAKEFHGIDISKAVYRAKNALKSSGKEPVLSQADLNALPYLDNSFDVIVSNGVFHHTPDTKIALKNCIKKLKTGGLCLFYIYKKKAPLREFADDYIRDRISDLSYDSAMKAMEPITNLAKSLHEQSIKIQIPNDVEILGIKKGEYDLQRFIYQFFFKCFWNKSWGFEYSNMTNYDWYHPKFAWRHTKTEIQDWCKEFNLQTEYIKETESGYTCLVKKT
jgi:arsenite methyltransferase